MFDELNGTLFRAQLGDPAPKMTCECWFGKIAEANGRVQPADCAVLWPCADDKAWPRPDTGRRADGNGANLLISR
jgi:hypothetical protein